MKKALLLLISLECLVLFLGLALHVTGVLDRFGKLPPPLPVFHPPLEDARIGDLVRYERRDRTTGRVLGYLDYKVLLVMVTQGTTSGPEIILSIKETDEGHVDEHGVAVPGTSRERTMSIQPRALMKGFLPPRFEDEDDYPAGERPVVSRISTATFPLRELPASSPRRPPPPPVHGFLVEAVIPRQSLTEVAERYWMTDEVPVFGIARFERGDEVLVFHHGEKPERKG